MKIEGESVTSHSAPLVIGAGGWRCPVAQKIVDEIYGEDLRNDDHLCGAYREYWTGVKGVGDEEGAIELHFCR